MFLDAVAKPFDAVNYPGSRVGWSLLTTRRMGLLFDRVTAALDRGLDAETDDSLARGMHYPTPWDPHFADYMTLADVYRFPTRHFDHHRQLTLGG